MTGGLVFTPLFDRVHEPGGDEKLFKAIKAEVRRKLSEMEMLTQPPRFFGYPYRNWREDGALDEIGGDAYEYLFRRYRAMAARRREQENIDPFFYLNVKHFLFERQRTHDPIGNNVYWCMRETATLLAARGDWEQTGIRASGKPGTGSILRRRGSSREVASPDEISSVITTHERWSMFVEVVDGGKLAPERRERGALLLVEILDALAGVGVASMLFGQLVATVANEARGPWNAGELTAEHDVEIAAGSFEAWIEVKSEVKALEHAMRESGDSDKVIARRLAVLDELVHAAQTGERDADIARDLEMDPRRFSDDKKAIQKIFKRLQNEQTGRTGVERI